MLCCYEIIVALRGPTFFWCAMQYFAIFVSIVLKALWLYPGYSGNANFLFNQHLIFLLSSGSLVAQFAASALRLERAKKTAAVPTVVAAEGKR